MKTAPSREFAIGMVVKDRWDLTNESLLSLYKSEQPSSSFDLYIIDNGSDPETNAKIRNFVASNLVPAKKVFVIPKSVSIPVAWNLFLLETQDYNYRVKFDNDLTVAGTIPVAQTESNSGPPTTAEAILQGAPLSTTVIRSIGQTRQGIKKKKVKPRTDFMNLMKEFSVKHNVDVSALVPVNPPEPFSKVISILAGNKHRGRPFLFGACMMISKKCFDTIGYFDERLPCRIDIEYSQRAVRNGLNIGYHPEFYVNHIGAGKHTVDRVRRNAMLDQAQKLERSLKVIPRESGTVWESVARKIKIASNSNRIITLG